MKRPSYYIETLRNRYRQKAVILRTRGLSEYFKNQTGYVLIIVLIISALLIGFSSEFMVTSQTNTNYIRMFRDRVSAETLADAGLEISKYMLDADRTGNASQVLPGLNTNKNTDTFKDLWALDFPEMPVEGGSLEIRIEDEQAKINLSALANEFVDKTPYYVVLQRFLMNMGLPLDLADTAIDWVDIDDSRFPFGAETFDYYSILPVPYRAKNGPFESINELLMVKGYTPEIFYGLGGGNFGKEYNLVDHNRGLPAVIPGMSEPLTEEEEKAAIADLPVGPEKNRRLDEYFRVHGDPSDFTSNLNKININTASYRVLASLADTMTDDRVIELIRRRNKQPFSSIDEVKDLIDDEPTRKNLISINSDIFQIIIKARSGMATVTMRAIYNRSTKNIDYISIQ